VDDDDALRAVTSEVLARDGWAVSEASDGESARGLIGARAFDLVVLDQRLPDADGVDLLEEFRRGGYHGAAILMTGYPTVGKAIAALGSAATGYLCKPVNPAALLEACRRVREGDHGSDEWEYLWGALRKRYAFHSVLSADPGTRGAYISAARVADSRATLLIEGETGTGKEYLARAVHYMSDRRDAAFVAVNCGAIPEALLESELFGHEKGAFTSATSAKRGLCEMADGGTLFLDEIGELSLAAQVKLLRFLQDRSLTRLGGVQPVQVDVRVIAATNRDLLTAVREGRFREDLFYRVAVVPLRLPPLRERPADVPLFARHFLAQARAARKGGPRDLSAEAEAILCGHPWPGNLRELHNTMQRAVLLGKGKQVEAADIQLIERHPLAAEGGSELLSMWEAEQRHARRVLERVGHDLEAASAILGVGVERLLAYHTAPG
jgi:DNA-binding NtrC family response regulator